MLVGVVFFHLLCVIGSRVPPVPASRRHRVVVTTQGAVRGYFAPHPPHFAYLGLPYSRRPTRHSRFKAPEPPPSWDGVFEATHRVKCPQGNGGDENCLVVNIFAPEDASSLPVLVLIHDGDFQNGWGPYHTPGHFLRKDLVIVTFNYRIGALGFLCLGIPEIPGNAGLKDQIAALYWIQQNIARFGGSPHDVTLYGIGSGAASIQLLLFTGMTEGLFHKVILESGSALSPSSLAYNPVSKGLEVAIRLGYQGEANSKDIVAFFRKIHVKQLLNVTEMFLPCIESNFHTSHKLLDIDPVKVLKEGNFQKVPMLITYTNADEISLIHNYGEKFDAVPENFEYLLPNNLEFDSEKTRQKIAEIVKEFYFQNDNDLVRKYSEYIHDIFTGYPIVKSAQLHAARSSQPVYLLKFSYKSSTENLAVNNQVRKIRNINDYVYSVDNLGQEDELVSERLATMWSNFIKLGDPTPLATSLIPVIWEPVIVETSTDLSKVPELLFDRTLRMSEHQSHQRLTFWDHIYDKFYKLYA